jgi:hypothetical protein
MTLVKSPQYNLSLLWYFQRYLSGTVFEVLNLFIYVEICSRNSAYWQWLLAVLHIIEFCHG